MYPCCGSNHHGARPGGARARKCHETRRVAVSAETSSLSRTDVNIVHISRPVRLASKPDTVPERITATLHPEHAQRTAEDLVRDLPDPDLQQLVYQDVLGIAQQLGRVLGPGPLSVKLEQLDRQSCPKWHADFVGVRCLVTYTGPGTWYVPNRAVKRGWDMGSGDVHVKAVDVTQAEQVSPGDWLFLKGHGFPGLYGMGAVHKSPEVANPHQDWRLLLTVDDSCQDACCW